MCIYYNYSENHEAVESEVKKKKSGKQNSLPFTI